MKLVLAVAIAVTAPAFAADPPNSETPKKTEVQPAEPLPNDARDMKTSPRLEPSPAATDTTAAISKDSEVLAKLHHINDMEVKAGQLAKKNGQAKQVKQFGDLLIKDHTMADKQITALAKKKNIDLTMPPPKDEDEKAERQANMDTMDKLGTLKGDEFDREFTRMMVDGHQQAVDMVEAAVKQTTDAKVQSLLNKLLPVLREHLRVAQQISKKVESV
jgi:putative membrane protein